MKNKLSDLNDHLFAQIERLADEELTPEQIETEAKRGDAIVAVADQIIRMGEMQLKAAAIVGQAGKDATPFLIALAHEKAGTKP